LSSGLAIVASKEGLRFDVLVKARASRTAVLGVEAERLGVALAAAPVDGAANEALRRLLAEYFSLPRQSVVIVGGERSRRKRVELRGITEAELRARLGTGG
jgi:uncharacterized protein (TIGR00251 family)